jgi:hypothetical protein
MPAFQMQNQFRLDQQAVMQFLGAEGCQPDGILGRLCSAYGNACVSKIMVIE